MNPEIMHYDIIIVGAGPSGLSAAIRIKQKCPELSVCILEKGAQVGSHLLSGAVLNPISLKNLLPQNWKEAPLDTPVKQDKFYLLTQKYAFKLPTPKPMRNKGNFIISLGELGQFLARHAEALGCEIYPGFAAKNLLFSDSNEIMGVATGELGVNKQGEKTDRYQSSMHLHAQYTLFAEGARGELSEKIIKHFNLRKDAMQQTYGLGIKEIWKIDQIHHQPGLVMHTVGWPMNHATYGGSFIYHLSKQQVAIGYVVGLDYQNPYLSPFEEMQRFKTHPFIKSTFENAERISYGARALNEGGYQSIPKLTFPGGALIGDSAGFLNVPQIKGIHSAIQSGIHAADACVEALKSTSGQPKVLKQYEQSLRQSWVVQSLYQVRNIRAGFKWGLIPGLMNAAFETYISRGYVPWTLSHSIDHKSLKLAKSVKSIDYPKPDGQLTFDRLSSVQLTNTHHEEDQTCHLFLKDQRRAIEVNYLKYDTPESRYCPAAVYEIVFVQDNPQLQINASNCIHCKTCDIKDMTQNIIWEAPEGGGGPNYIGM